MLLLPHRVQVFFSTLWIWGLNSCAWVCASALYVFCCCSGYQFPFSLVPHHPVPQECSWHCRASRMALAVHVQALQLSSHKTEQWSFWQVSSLAMSFLLDFSCLLFFLTLWSQAGILLSSFCLDRAGGSVWSLVREMFLCFLNSKTKWEDYLPMNFTLFWQPVSQL